VRTDKLFGLVQKKQYCGIKTNSKFNFQYTIGKSTLYTTENIMRRVFSFLF
jgi:hypothetical protein